MKKFEVFGCFNEITSNSENPLRNPLQRHYSGDFDPENAYQKPPVILKVLLLEKINQQQRSKNRIHQ
jgi:hypothetical protein